jgi:hypothetical protein
MWRLMLICCDRKIDVNLLREKNIADNHGLHAMPFEHFITRVNRSMTPLPDECKLVDQIKVGMRTAACYYANKSEL